MHTITVLQESTTLAWKHVWPKTRKRISDNLSPNPNHNPNPKAQ